MRVSVIIPLYNKAATIRRALASVAAQTFRDFELIVVDDGSSDGSRELARSFRALPLQLIEQDNSGPGAARNRGAAAAAGEILAFLDADDEWLPAYLAHAVAKLDAYPQAAAVVSGYVEHPAQRSRSAFWRRRGIDDGLFRLTPDTPLLQAVHRIAYMSPWSTAIRADSFRRWGGFYARERCLYAEDAHLWLKVLLNEQVLYSLTPMVRFHRENSALSRNLEGPRPIEPFLHRPAEILDAAPAALRPLAERILALRAAKTACMLGYWGKWREARSLMRRHLSPNVLLTPYGLPALVCSTPAAALAGPAARRCSRALLAARRAPVPHAGEGKQFLGGPPPRARETSTAAAAGRNAG